MDHPSGGASPLNVLVAGMHRSGTSAVSLALHAAGLGLGNPGSEMRSAPENMFGFGERNDVVSFDDRLLGSLGWTWDSPPPMPLTEPPDRPGSIQEGRELVARAMPVGNPWLIKDPRLSLLMPWWRKILLDRFVAVVSMRPVEEVAWSLHVRNDFPVSLGIAITGAYLRHLSVGLRGLPVIIVDYVSLVEQPLAVLTMVLDALQTAGVRGSFDADQGAKAIEPALRRATQPNNTMVESTIPRATWRLVFEWMRGPVVYRPRCDFEGSEPMAWEESMLLLQRRLQTRQEHQAQLTKHQEPPAAEPAEPAEPPTAEPAEPPAAEPRS